MPETNSVGLGRGAPTVFSEPVSSEPPDAQATMCVDPSARNAAGAGGATACPGAEELVRRFGGSEGAGPNLDQAAEPSDGPSCGVDALRTVGACGAAISLATGTGGLGAVFAGAVCAAALGGYLECLETEQEANRAGSKP